MYIIVLDISLIYIWKISLAIAKYTVHNKSVDGRGAVGINNVRKDSALLKHNIHYQEKMIWY